MIYYNNENRIIEKQAEKMFEEFLKYYKAKMSEPVKIQNRYEIGKGWPHFKGLDYTSLELDSSDTPLATPEAPNMPAAEPENGANNYYKTFPTPLGAIASPSSGQSDMYHLLSEVNKRLHPYVHEVLDRYEYEGSPVYDNPMDRESVAQIVDKILERAAENMSEVKEIIEEPEGNEWMRHRLLRALIEIIMLSELYHNRKVLYQEQNI